MLQAAGASRPGHSSARAGQAPQARVSPPTEGTRPGPQPSELAPMELDDSAMFRSAKPAPDPKPKPGPAAAPKPKPGGSMRDALPQLRKVCAPGALIELVGRAWAGLRWQQHCGKPVSMCMAALCHVLLVKWTRGGIHLW